MEPCQETFDLLFDCCGHSRIASSLHVLHLVILCHWDVSTIRDEIFYLDLPEVFLFVAECEVEISDIVLQKPVEVLVEVVVLLFQVVDG